MLNCLRRIIKNERGGTLIEYTIIYPLFLVLIFSILEMGLYFLDRAVVNQAAYDLAVANSTGPWQSVPQKHERWKAAEDLLEVAPTLDSQVTITPQIVGDYSTVRIVARHHFVVGVFKLFAVVRGSPGAIKPGPGRIVCYQKVRGEWAWKK